MSYDVLLWPVDRAITWAEARAEIERRDASWRIGLGHDRRLDPFIRALRDRYPGIGRGPDGPPVEFDIHRKHIFLAIGWSEVEAMVPVISEIAWGAGLAVIDPQREVVGLPAPLADAPLGPEGLDEHVRIANRLIGAVIAGATSADPDEPNATERAVSEQLWALGATLRSPLGFEITPDVEDEAIADPNGVPVSLQTAAWRDELIATLAGTHVGHRHRALASLAGWGPDPAVASALRPLLASDDVFEGGSAASGLARQGDLTDLPAVLDLTQRFSPADGGTADAMLLPLRASLELVAQAGPEMTAAVKARAREWRGTPPTRRRDWGGDIDALLDELLAD